MFGGLGSSRETQTPSARRFAGQDHPRGCAVAKGVDQYTFCFYVGDADRTAVMGNPMDPVNSMPGNSFDGNDNNVSRVSLAFAQITGQTCYCNRSLAHTADAGRASSTSECLSGFQAHNIGHGRSKRDAPGSGSRRMLHRAMESRTTRRRLVRAGGSRPLALSSPAIHPRRPSADLGCLEAIDGCRTSSRHTTRDK
jgi:hypothetical protein